MINGTLRLSDIPESSIKMDYSRTHWNTAGRIVTVKAAKAIKNLVDNTSFTSINLLALETYTIGFDVPYSLNINSPGDPAFLNKKVYDSIKSRIETVEFLKPENKRNILDFVFLYAVHESNNFRFSPGIISIGMVLYKKKIIKIEDYFDILNIDHPSFKNKIIENLLGTTIGVK